MSLTVKTLLYVAFLFALYCEETQTPVMLYVRRFIYLTNWYLAAWMTRRTLSSYQSYIAEAENVRG